MIKVAVLLIIVTVIAAAAGRYDLAAWPVAVFIAFAIERTLGLIEWLTHRRNKR